MSWADHIWDEDTDVLDRVWLFEKPYRWRNENGQVTLEKMPEPLVRLGKWPCCGKPRPL